jgi:hypothetical protein
MNADLKIFVSRSADFESAEKKYLVSCPSDWRKGEDVHFHSARMAILARARTARESNFNSADYTDERGFKNIC